MPSEGTDSPSLLQVRGTFFAGDAVGWDEIEQVWESVYGRPSSSGSNVSHPVCMLRHWIQDEWKTHIASVSHTMTAHCDLLKTLVTVSFERHASWWSASKTEPGDWSRLLVESGYPWFVCSLWLANTEWAPLCSVKLIRAAAGYAYDGYESDGDDDDDGVNEHGDANASPPSRELHPRLCILHQLLLHEVVGSVWEIPEHAPPEDWEWNAQTKNTCLSEMCRTSGKSFYRQWIATKLNTFPFDDTERSDWLCAQLCRSGAWKCLRDLVRYATSHGLRCMSDHVARDILSGANSGLSEDVLRLQLCHQDEEAPTRPGFWSSWFLCILPGQAGKTTHSEDTQWLKTFGVVKEESLKHLTPQGWCHMLLHVTEACSCANGACVLSELMSTCGTVEALRQVDHVTQDCIRQLPPGEVTEIRVANGVVRRIYWDDIRARGAPSWLEIVNRELLSAMSWSLFANAIRWSDSSVVQWCVQKGCSVGAMSLCRSRRTMAMDNALTLAISNTDNGVLHVVLEDMDKHWVDSSTGRLDPRLEQQWFREDRCFSLGTAFGRIRPWHHRHALNKLRLVLPYASEAIRECKGIVMAQMVHTWSIRADDSDAHTSNGSDGLQRVWEHPVVRTLLQLPAPFRSMYAESLFRTDAHQPQTLTRSECTELVQWLRTTCRMTHTHELICQLSTCSPRPFPDHLLTHIVSHPLVATDLRGRLSRRLRCRVILSWAGRSAAALSSMMRVARDSWGWCMRAEFPVQYTCYFESCLELPMAIKAAYALPGPSIGCPPLPDLWAALLREGMLPLVWCDDALPECLNRQLRAHRVVRRALRKRHRKLRELQQFRHHQCGVCLENHVLLKTVCKPTIYVV